MTSPFRRWERNHRDDASWFPMANVSVPVVLEGFLQLSPFFLAHVCVMFVEFHNTAAPR